MPKYTNVPEPSVVVPTDGRSESIVGLLEDLRHQPLAPERFEVIVVDDGSPVPVEVHSEAFPFHVKLLYQTNAGTEAACKLGLVRADVFAQFSARPTERCVFPRN